MRLRLRRFGLALALATAGAALIAQAPADPAVAIDFFALGPGGSVVDLRPSEISLKVDGKRRDLTSLKYVNLPLAPSSRAASRTPADLEPPFGSNVPEAPGRWVTVIVDHESVRAGTERHALNAVIRTIEALGPRDQISYVTMPNGGVEVDFTDRREQVSDALRKFIGRAPRESSIQERSCRTRLLLNTMADYLEGLAPLEGPKTIVLVSSGMLNPRRDAPMLGPPGPCEIRMVYYQEVALAASRARASVFVLQPDDVHMDPARQVFVDPLASRFAGADEDRAGLESLAGVTGGEFMRIVQPDDDTLLEHVRVRSGYYVLTFDPEPGERNGAPHRVQLDVTRPNVRIRTRPEVYISRRVSTRPSQAAPKDMLRNGIMYRALPLRTVAYASGGEGGKVKVLAVLEPSEPGVKITQAMFGLIDGRDRLVAQWTANASELASAPIVTAGEAAPGPYRLRVAAIDANGRRGTAEFSLVLRLTEAPPLTLSGLALGVSRDGIFMPRMVFDSDQAAVAYFEIYGRPSRGDSVSVRLELAEGPDAPPLTASAPRVVARGDEQRMVVGALPISALAPGDYVVRAIVSVDGQPVGRVTRTLRKSLGGS